MAEVTISRYRGEKRLSSLPHTLALAADGRLASSRIGGEVPIKAQAGAPSTMFSYRRIGTSIDMQATEAEEGRFRLLVTVDEDSVYGSDDGISNGLVANDVPAFRSFRSVNAVTLRDGQTLEYTAATDRLTGEVAKITVKLTVMK